MGGRDQQWELLEGCIAGVFPEAIVTPYIMMGGVSFYETLIRDL
ncbi:hypothetical protein [Arthrobacter sp. NicSoilB4]|nr:hypothetical protein [Arthrobacter sp. NicSoilB4]